MSDLLSFHSSLGIDVRFVEIDGSYYANGFDCATALDFSNPARDIQIKVWKEYRFKFNADKSVGQPGWWLNEYGVHQLIFASDHPKAVEFQRWVFEEVLPEIRQQGGYISPDATDDQLFNLIRRILEMSRDRIREVVSANRPAVAEEYKRDQETSIACTKAYNHLLRVKGTSDEWEARWKHYELNHREYLIKERKTVVSKIIELFGLYLNETRYHQDRLDKMEAFKAWCWQNEVVPSNNDLNSPYCPAWTDFNRYLNQQERTASSTLSEKSQEPKGKKRRLAKSR